MQPRHGRFEGGLTALAQRRETRRGLLIGSAKVAAGGALAVVFAGRPGGWAFAQGTPAASALASLGLPELKITATDTAYEGLSAENAAGWYLVTLTNSGKGPATADFMQLPQGMAIGDFQALLKGAAGTPESGTPMAAATATAAGTPSAAEQGPPPWYYQVYMAGGAAAPPGQTVQAVVELRPGDYAVWGEDPTAPQTPQGLKVTGTAPAAPPAPTTDVTVDEVNTANGFAFKIDGTFKSGPQVVKVVNSSDQPHFVIVLKSPVALTRAQAEQLAMLEGNATPPAGLPNPNEIQPVAEAATQSAGATTWHVFDLEAGHYIIACFVTDPKTGKTHAMEGMIDVFDIGG